jgi:putative acetyltransferase
MSDIVIRHAEPRDAEPLRQLTAHPEVYHDTLQLPHPSMEMWQERLQPKPTATIWSPLLTMASSVT